MTTPFLAACLRERLGDTTRLEDLKPNAAVRGILPDCLVTVVGVQWFGSEALEVTYKDPGGHPVNVSMINRRCYRLRLFRWLEQSP